MEVEKLSNPLVFRIQHVHHLLPKRLLALLARELEVADVPHPMHDGLFVWNWIVEVVERVLRNDGAMLPVHGLIPLHPRSTEKSSVKGIC